MSHSQTQKYELDDNNHFVTITVNVHSERDSNAQIDEDRVSYSMPILNDADTKYHLTNGQSDCIIYLLTHIMNNIQDSYMSDDEDEEYDYEDAFTKEEKRLLATAKPEFIRHSEKYTMLVNCRRILHNQYIDTIYQLSNDIRHEYKKMKLNAILGLDSDDSDDDEPVCIHRKQRYEQNVTSNPFSLIIVGFLLSSFCSLMGVIVCKFVKNV